MAESRIDNLRTVLDAVGATGAGTTLDISDYRHVMMQLGTSGSADMTIKCQGSLSKTAPDFNLPASVDNNYDTVAMYDYQDPTAIITGDAGVVLTGTDDFRNFIVNIDGLKWINFNITDYSAGEATVKVRPFNNN